jgi:hypothetical protein
VLHDGIGDDERVLAAGAPQVGRRQELLRPAREADRVQRLLERGHNHLEIP